MFTHTHTHTHARTDRAALHSRACWLVRLVGRSDLLGTDPGPGSEAPVAWLLPHHAAHSRGGAWVEPSIEGVAYVVWIISDNA